MKNQYLRLSPLFLVMMLLFVGSSMGQDKKNTKPGARILSPFRYVMVDNVVDPRIDKKDEDRRRVEVVMDKKSFSEENLTLLFNLISKRFPSPKLLFVSVFTDLNDVETPEEREQAITSGQNGPGDVGDTAVFTRSEYGMSYSMYFANGDFDEVKMRPLQ